MYSNHTTLHISTPRNKREFHGYYSLIPVVLLILIGCVVAMVIYIKRKRRLGYLRHRLIPLYSYDPAEGRENWGDAGRCDEDEELNEPLYKKAQLSLSSGPCCFLTSILLVTAVVLPALTLNSLLCYYCPLQQKGKPCPQTTSQCLPDQRCAISRGHYGSFHILSSQGCVNSGLCGSHKIVTYQGVKYNVSYACCCENQCNIPPKSDSTLKKLLDMIASKFDHVSNTTALKEEPWNSCPNSTS